VINVFFHIFPDIKTKKLIDEILDDYQFIQNGMFPVSFDFLLTWIDKKFNVAKENSIRREVIRRELLEDLNLAKERENFSLATFVILLIKHEAPGHNAMPNIHEVILEKMTKRGIFWGDKKILIGHV
jgi:hypothetical protein